MIASEFEEIGHSGGKVIFDIRIDDKNNLKYSVGYSHSRPVPLALLAVYALPQGIPVGSIQMGGIGQPWNPPPFSGCYPVFIASDSVGKFGHNCPDCKGYWRSGSGAKLCPYCGIKGEFYQFLSTAQLRYLRHYCNVLSEALMEGKDGEVVIDMDSVADAAGKDGEKPAFYVSEQSQQRKFTCKACGEFNDILGRFGYCSLCGTRNDLADFEDITVPAVRERLNNNKAPEDCLRDAVAEFDSFIGQMAKELARLIPMTEQRNKRLTKKRFHDFKEVKKIFSDWFDIDMCSNMDKKKSCFMALMFHRRHVYEHNGGEVDQKYLDNSGDKTVRLKQRIHESKEDLHRFLNGLIKMAQNLHEGFHKLFSPIPEPIKIFDDKKKRMAKYSKSNT